MDIAKAVDADYNKSMIYKKGRLSVTEEKVHIENEHAAAVGKHYLALTDYSLL